MATLDLDWFQVNCRLKEQQIAFLQSQRQTSNERLAAGGQRLLTPWKVITDPATFQQQTVIHNGYHNWSINQLLLQLANNCP
jgi:putative AlgH/UPF0301 family transcriptional regulator